MITKNTIFDFLKENGIKNSDTVTIHSSLRSIGPIENGADGLIDAFKEYLHDGLFIIPTHTWANVNKNSPIYDARNTVPCIGTLPKIAAFRKDGVRSLHPTHSVAVFGKNAQEFVKNEELSETPCPVGGVMSRLYDMNAKILLVGVGLERNTYLHAVDEMIDVKNRLNSETFKPTIIDLNGNERPSKDYHTHYAKGIGDCSKYFPNYKNAFDHFGAIRYSKLGNAQVYCCDAKKITDITIRLWEKADYDLCSGYKDVPKEYYINECFDF